MSYNFRFLVLSLTAAFTVAAAEINDAQWQQMRQELLDKPRRVFLDDDGCDALNFPPDKEITLENFYAQMMAPLVGSEMDVLVYCPGTTGFAVSSKTKSGHRMLTSNNPPYRNITQDLERMFGADPATLAQRFAREHGFEFVMSMRGNDDHDSYNPDKMSAFKKAHLDLLVGGREASQRPQVGGWASFDFARKEVRDLFKSMVCEWFENYDLDGFIIDFQRGNVYFKSVAQGGNVSQEEMEALTQMLREIHTCAEQCARRRGRPMYYVFRAPDSVDVCRLMGLDIEKWMAEGLFDIYVAGGDMGHFTPYAQNVALAHKYGLKCYISQDISWMKADPALFARNTFQRYDAEFAAAYAAGADGVYMFNMCYVTNYYSLVRKKLSDLAGRNKNYFATIHTPRHLCSTQPQPGQDGLLTALYPQYPLNLKDTTPRDYLLEIGDDVQNLPDGIPAPTTQLFLKTSMSAEQPLTVKVNGVPAVFKSLRNTVACYDVPLTALRQGQNTLSIAASAPVSTKEKPILSGKEILQGDNQPPWRRLFPGSGAAGAEEIVEGAYRLKSVASGPTNLMYPFGSMNGQDVTVKVEVRTEPDAAAGSVSLRVANGRFVEVVDFIPDRVRLRYANHQVPVDATVFHDYTLSIAADGSVVLLMDGKRLLEGRTHAGAQDAKYYLKGYHLDMPGMHDASLLIGGLDIGAAGAGLWRNLRYVTTSLTISDAMLQVTFPPHLTPLMRNALDKKEYIYRQECAEGVFTEVQGVKKGYPPLEKAKDMAGVLFDHTQAEWHLVNMAQFAPLQTPHRFMTAEWKITCTKPPRKATEQNFQLVLRPQALHASGRPWNFMVRSAEGQIVTPFGTTEVPVGAQRLAAVIDCTTGEAAVLLDGKVVASGQLATTNDEVCVLFGDGSSIISGAAVLEYIRLGYFDL